MSTDGTAGPLPYDDSELGSHGGAEIALGEDLGGLMRRTLIAVCGFGLLLASCGGGSDEDAGAGDGLDADAQAISDAIYDQILEDGIEDSPFGPTEARCFSDGVARDFGVAELIELGLSADDIRAGAEPGDVELSDSQADRMTDLMVDCVDFRSLFVDEFTGEGVSQESAECLADGFDDELIRTLAKSELVGDGADPLADPQIGESLIGLITNCLSFEELSGFGDG